MKKSVVFGFAILLILLGCVHYQKQSQNQRSFEGLFIETLPNLERSPAAARPMVIPAEKRMRVLALSDFHGALDPQAPPDSIVKYGGAAMVASYIKMLRETADSPVFLFDAGDMFQGTLVSNTVEGAATVKFYNGIRVDAAAIGNHEFDYGPAGRPGIPSKPSEDPRGALKARIRQARFPILAANIRMKDRPDLSPSWARKSVLIKRGNVTVGVIGAATIQTGQTTKTGNVKDLLFIDPVNPVLDESKRLRAKGADFVVLLIHTGGSCKNNSPQALADLSSCSLGKEIDTLLKTLPRGTLDLAIGGHTHRVVNKIINDVPFIQPAATGTLVGSVVLSKANALKVEKMELIPTCETTVTLSNGSQTCDPNLAKQSTETPKPAVFLGKTMVRDAETEKLLAPEFARVKALQEQKLGMTVEKKFEKGYTQENSLSNLIVDVLKTRVPEADIVVYNNGGMRSDLPAGELTYGAVFNIMPFDNQLALMEIDGATLKAIAKIGVSMKNGALAWSGATLKADNCEILEMTVNNSPLVPDKMYRVLASDFIATGGMDISKLQIPPEQIRMLEHLGVQRDELVEGLKQWKKPLLPELYYQEDSLERTVIMNPCSSTPSAPASQSSSTGT